MEFGLKVNYWYLSLGISSEQGAGWTGKDWAVSICMQAAIGLSFRMMDGYWLVFEGIWIDNPTAVLSLATEDACN